MEVVTIDNQKYDMASLSDSVKTQLVNIRFVDDRIAHLRGELAISDTARMAYLAALKRELKI